jgi:DNA-binding response OmpR family regulator
MTTTTYPTLAVPTGNRTRTVLVADESDATRALLADNLIADGYRVCNADSRAAALEILSEDRMDVIVVDVNGDTLGLIDAIRAGGGPAGCLDRDVPMLVLTTKADAVHRTRLLDRGGDDVLGKPFSYPELRSRIAALLRRAERRQTPPAPALLQIGVLSLDPIGRTVRVDGRLVELTAKEQELLRTLAADPTRVLTRVNFELPEPKGRKGVRNPGASGGRGGRAVRGDARPFDNRALSGARFWRTGGVRRTCGARPAFVVADASGPRRRGCLCPGTAAWGERRCVA